MSEVAPAREKPSLALLYGLAAVALVVAGLRLAAPVLVPVALALFLAILVQPLYEALLRRTPTGIAVLATVLLLGAVVGLFGLLLLGSLAEIREVGPHYARSLQERVAGVEEWWRAKGIALADWIPPRWRRPEAIVELAGGTVVSALRLLSGATIVLLTLVFLLVESAAFPRKLARLPAPVRDGFRHLTNVSRELQRYLVIKTLVAAAIGLVIGIWIAVLGVDFAVLCALLAFALHFVPNVGAVLAAGPAMLLGFVQFDLPKALVVGLGYLVVGFVLGNLAEPALLGRRLNLSPLAVFLSLVAWGWLWGPIGMFLSVPLTMAIKIVLEHSRDWHWVARILDGAPPLEAEAPPAPAAEAATAGERS